VARHNRRVRFALLDDSEAMVLGGKPDGRPVVAGDACATSWGSALLQLSERRRRVDIALYFCDLSLGYMDRMQVSGRSRPAVALFEMPTITGNEVRSASRRSSISRCRQAQPLWLNPSSRPHDPMGSPSVECPLAFPFPTSFKRIHPMCSGDPATLPDFEPV